MSAASLAARDPARRPLLRGWSHALAAVGALAFTVALGRYAVGDTLRLATVLLYGICSVWLFACSALYHVVTWSPPRRALLRAMDHGNIYIVIAATSTAIGANVLSGWQLAIPLVLVWVLALSGVAVTVFHVRFGAGPRVALCLANGCAGAIAAPGLLYALPPVAILGIVAGGALYALGGVVYASRKPDPFPRIFGYHEVFHLLVIAGGATFGAVIWLAILP